MGRVTPFGGPLCTAKVATRLLQGPRPGPPRLHESSPSPANTATGATPRLGDTAAVPRVPPAPLHRRTVPIEAYSICLPWSKGYQPLDHGLYPASPLCRAPMHSCTHAPSTHALMHSCAHALMRPRTHASMDPCAPLMARPLKRRSRRWSSHLRRHQRYFKRGRRYMTSRWRSSFRSLGRWSGRRA